MPFQGESFDREALAEHRVTRRDLEDAGQYVALLQGADSPTYRDIAAGCYYATSALLHEVIEVRILLARDRRLLRRSRQQVKRFLEDNEDAHVARDDHRVHLPARCHQGAPGRVNRFGGVGPGQYNPARF